jgi:hypothetical protein
MKYTHKCSCCNSLVTTEKSIKLEDIRCESCILLALKSFENQMEKVENSIAHTLLELARIKKILDGGK